MTNLQFVSCADENEQRRDKGDVRWIPIAYIATNLSYLFIGDNPE